MRLVPNPLPAVGFGRRSSMARPELRLKNVTEGGTNDRLVEVTRADGEECEVRVLDGHLFVCKACCCGNVGRGFPEVPLEEFKSQWEARGIRRRVHLTVSGCLGPCAVANRDPLPRAAGKTGGHREHDGGRARGDRHARFDDRRRESRSTRRPRMNGIHDMGGMDGMGPIEPEKNGAAVHEPWALRVFALGRATGRWGRGRNWPAGS